MPENSHMGSAGNEGLILVTGASGHIGAEVCRVLRTSESTPPPALDAIRIPLAPEATLSLVHVREVARMPVTLAEAVEMGSSVYNTPAEIWEARHLKEVVEEVRRIQVELGQEGAHERPMCDGSLFARDFGFQLRGIWNHFSNCAGST